MGRQKRRTAKKRTKKYKYSRRKNTLRKKYSRRKKSKTYRKQSGGTESLENPSGPAVEPHGTTQVEPEIASQEQADSETESLENPLGPAVEPNETTQVEPEIASQEQADSETVSETSPQSSFEYSKSGAIQIAKQLAKEKILTYVPEEHKEIAKVILDKGEFKGLSKEILNYIPENQRSVVQYLLNSLDKESVPVNKSPEQLISSLPGSPDTQELLQILKKQNTDNKKNNAKLAGLVGLTTLANNPATVAAAGAKAAALGLTAAPVLAPVAAGAAGLTAAYLAKQGLGSFYDVAKYKTLIANITQCLKKLVAYAVISEAGKDALLNKLKENLGEEKTFKKDLTLKSSVRKEQKQKNKELEAALAQKREEIANEGEVTQ